jgi:hypothetical protein
MSRSFGLLAVLLSAGLVAARPSPLAPDPDARRPIEALDTVFVEEMTWTQIVSTAILPG